MFMDINGLKEFTTHRPSMKAEPGAYGPGRIFKSPERMK